MVKIFCLDNNVVAVAVFFRVFSISGNLKSDFAVAIQFFYGWGRVEII